MANDLQKQIWKVMKLKLHSENCHVWRSSLQEQYCSPLERTYEICTHDLKFIWRVFSFPYQETNLREVILLRSRYMPCLKVKMIYVLYKTIYKYCFCTCIKVRNYFCLEATLFSTKNCHYYDSFPLLNLNNKFWLDVVIFFKRRIK